MKTLVLSVALAALPGTPAFSQTYAGSVAAVPAAATAAAGYSATVRMSPIVSGLTMLRDAFSTPLASILLPGIAPVKVSAVVKNAVLPARSVIVPIVYKGNGVKSNDQDKTSPDEVPAEYPERTPSGPDWVPSEFPERSGSGDGPDDGGGVLFRTFIRDTRSYAQLAAKAKSGSKSQDSTNPDEVPAEYPDRTPSGPDNVPDEFPSRGSGDGPDDSGGALFRGARW
ncbi:MAG: hypothetical protein WC969_01880 [Elusimicrobiota bacterium]|jgi:hypothetical protein